MGPERKAPENDRRPYWKNVCSRSFNGAGAKGSGKQINIFNIDSNFTSFNGAGAKGSGKPHETRRHNSKSQRLQWGRSERLRKTANNRNRPRKRGQRLQWGRSERLRKTPNDMASDAGGSEASMGPERKAPENSPYPSCGSHFKRMLQWGRSERLRKTSLGLQHQSSTCCFNGAGAKGSGKPRASTPRGRLPGASMGPERKAPENLYE